jgi:MurNAc alpha-1-phosphate uridylyltransferase
VLETCINLLESLGIQQIIINTFYLKDQIHSFINGNKFRSKILIIEDGDKILDTGGGINNMMNIRVKKMFLIFNPDTIWKKNYTNEIIEMEKLYFSKQIKNILLLVKKELSFDKNLSGDFDLIDNLIIKNNDRKFIYTGCQIINKNFFLITKIKIFQYQMYGMILLKKKNYMDLKLQKSFII